ncbi:MAG: hypothetical protein ACTSUB_08835 [Candidatus Thorarchaeota archaeon]
MAEQFLSRLEKIEESIESLGQMLTRMITLLGAVTELKSDLRGIKDEIIVELKSAPQPAPTEAAGPSITTDEVKAIVQTELRDTTDLILQALAGLKNDITAASTSPAPATPFAASEPSPVIEGSPSSQRSSSLSADKGMKVADLLETILKSLKMGCKAGDVLEVMAEAKAEILKIVPSDAIMIKIDRWAGVVGGYSKRHELQARDILKLKKELKAEIPNYRPA